MVQMHPMSSATNVTYEAEGGIRNPVCQDDDSPNLQQQQQQKPSARQEQQQQHWPASGGAERDSAAKKSIGVGEPCKVHDKKHELKEAMTLCRTKLPWRFSFNVVFGLTVLIVISLGELGIIPSQQVGFYCNDPKISHKFTGDTISAFILVSVSIFVPALVIWLIEWSCYSSDSYKSLDCASSSRSRQFWVWYGYYTIGWIYMISIVEIMKVTVGEPRPHFIDSCRPRENENCTNEFKRTYTCTNTKLSRFNVIDSDKSFPSGHAALSMFMTAYLVWYLQMRMPERLVLMLVKPWLQCIVIVWGMGCSMSRITDHRHHWWDVLVGAILGLVFAYFVVRVPCRNFRSGALLMADDVTSPLDGRQPGSQSGQTGGGYAAANKRHQSVKKLLSQSSIEPPEDRELGDMPSSWSA